MLSGTTHGHGLSGTGGPGPPRRVVRQHVGVQLDPGEGRVVAGGRSQGRAGGSCPPPRSPERKGPGSSLDIVKHIYARIIFTIPDSPGHHGLQEPAVEAEVDDPSYKGDGWDRTSPPSCLCSTNGRG